MIRGVLGSRASIGGVLGSGRGGAAAGNGLLTGLVAYWGLDEASGNALDKHTGGLTLTQNNSPGADTGKVYGSARTFDGSSQWFYRATETALQLGNVDFVLAAWAYLDTYKNGLIFSKWNVTTGVREYRLEFTTTGNKFQVQVGNAAAAATALTSTTAISLSTWYLVIARHVTGAPGTLYISVNGGTEQSTSMTVAAATGAADFAIGIERTTNPANYFDGRIGPAMIWKNRTLSAADRAALWNGGAGLAYSAFTV